MLLNCDQPYRAKITSLEMIPEDESEYFIVMSSKSHIGQSF